MKAGGRRQVREKQFRDVLSAPGMMALRDNMDRVPSGTSSQGGSVQGFEPLSDDNHDNHDNERELYEGEEEEVLPEDEPIDPSSQTPLAPTAVPPASAEVDSTQASQARGLGKEKSRGKRYMDLTETPKEKATQVCPWVNVIVGGQTLFRLW